MIHNRTTTCIPISQPDLCPGLWIGTTGTAVLTERLDPHKRSLSGLN